MLVTHAKEARRMVILASIAVLAVLLMGARLEFAILLGTLACILANHHKARKSALIGNIVMVAWVLITKPAVLHHTFNHDAITITDTVVAVGGFSLLATLIAKSGLLNLVARKSGNGFWGALFSLLWQVMSYGVDNVASALNGGAIAKLKYGERVHPQYLFAIAGLANAFGAMSAIGDGTSMCLWISGINYWTFWQAWPGVLVFFLIVAPVAAWQQARYAQGHERTNIRARPIRITPIVLFLLSLLAAILFRRTGLPASFGVCGGVITAYYLFKLRPKKREFRDAAYTVVFLFNLMFMAALCGVKGVPDPSFNQEMGLGIFSALFDNYPLTFLAIKQGFHDWPVLAFFVGVGGSILYFGNAASVALSEKFVAVKAIRFTWPMSVLILLAVIAGGYAIVLYHGGWHPTHIGG